MAKAGFWPIGGYKISFRSDGCWYADDEVIAHPRISSFFARHVRPAPGGGWMLDVGVDRQAIEVEDTPLVVVRVSGDPPSGIRITTNDTVEQDLECKTLEIGRDDVLYCEVDRGERGRMRARFLRPAYYDLMQWVDEQDGSAVLRCRGVPYTLVPRTRTQPA
jgi:hypothetical protein